MPTASLSDQKPNTALAAWVPDDVAYAMRLKAAINRRSISAELRAAIEQYLQNDERPGGNQGESQNTGRRAGYEPV